MTLHWKFPSARDYYVRCTAEDVSSIGDWSKDFYPGIGVYTVTYVWRVNVIDSAACSPDWACACPTDTQPGNSCGGGDGASTSTNLATGVPTTTFSTDIDAYNPKGAPASFQPTHMQAILPNGGYPIKLFYSSPGLPNGWLHPYDYVVYPTNDGTLEVVTPRGFAQVLTPQGTPGEATPLAVESGTPFTAEGDYEMVGGQERWTAVQLTWSDGSKWIFDGQGPEGTLTLTQMLDSLNHGLVITYNADGTLQHIQNTDDSDLLTFDYDALGYLTDVHDVPGGRHVVYDVNDEEHLVTISQVASETTTTPDALYTIGYRADGLLETIDVPMPIEGGSARTTLTYDSNKRLLTLSDGNGHTRTYTYGTNETKVASASPNGGQSFWMMYDSSNRYIGTRSDTTPSRTLEARTYGNDPWRPDSVTNAEGVTLGYSYGDWGEVLEVLDPAHHLMTTSSYELGVNGALRLLSVVEANTYTGDTRQTSYEYYEPSGLVMSVTSPKPGVAPSSSEMVTTLYEYDGGGSPTLGNVTEITAPGNSTDATIVTTLDYGATPKAGQPLTVTDNLGHSSHYVYDTMGNVSQVTDEEDNVTVYTYNVAGDLEWLVHPSSGATHETRQYVYLYPGGPLTDVKDYSASSSVPPAGTPPSANLFARQQYLYGGEGEVIEVRDWDPQRAGDHWTKAYSVTYDGEYRAVSHSDGKGNTTTYHYDALGRPDLVTYPAVGGTSDTVSFTYTSGTASALPATRVDGNGVTSTYTYDANRLTGITYSPETNPVTGPVALDYDAFGRVYSVTDPTGVLTYAYDDLGNVRQVDFAPNGPTWTKTITYTYNPDGSRASMNAAGNSFSYVYDAIGRMTQLTNPQGEVSRWQYEDNGWLNLQTLNDNAWGTSAYSLKTRYAYNHRGFLTSLKNLNRAEDYAYSQFTGLAYDAVGNTTSLTAGFGVYQQGFKGMVPMAPGLTYYNGTTTYQYGKTAGTDIEAFGLLRREQTSRFLQSTAKTFTYDDAGNPLTLRTSSPTIVYNDANQRTGTGYAYDGNGNATTHNGVTLVYDRENRLTRYGSTTQITSAYNALGLRVKKTVGTTNTWYLYDGAVPVLELSILGGATAINTFGPNGLISRRVSSATSFYAFDPLGSVANILNATGSVLYNCGYDAYGRAYWEPISSPYGYGGQYGYYKDTEAATSDKLLLCTFRWYDPTTARWLTRDPIGYDGGSNLYGYVGGNPVGALDPWGLVRVPPPSTWPEIPRNLQDDWSWEKDPANTRKGVLKTPPSGKKGVQRHCLTWDEKDHYWKYYKGDGKQHPYDRWGRPLTSDQAHYRKPRPRPPLKYVAEEVAKCVIRRMGFITRGPVWWVVPRRFPYTDAEETEA